MRDLYEGLEEFAAYWGERTPEERLYHIAHRIELVRFWDIQEGAKILEIGCGQGGTTFALALAVGNAGHITATDIASATYGTPPLGDVQGNIARSSVGDRITFQLSFDVLDPAVHFDDQQFDAIVLSHSSWYLNQPDELLALFRKGRAWARRLCFAEWDITPHYTAQIPHMLSVLLQVQIRALDEADEHREELNVRSLITPALAYQMAQEAGWGITKEQQLDSSLPFLEGKKYEYQIAQDLVRSVLQAPSSSRLQPYAKDLLRIESNLLTTMADNSSNLSLSTFAFCAE